MMKFYLKKKFNLNMKKEELFWGIVFVSPGFIFFIIFMLFPIILGFVLSFFRWDVIRPIRFVGLSNFIKMFTEDPKMGQVATSTLIYIVEVIPASVIISLVFAILLTKIKKFRGFFQSIYFLPLIASTVAISLVWRYVYSANFGLLNSLLRFFLDENIDWLRDPRFALSAISIIMIWKNISFNIILFLAAVRNVPDQLYEAARIDGCRELGLFKYITIAQIKPTIVLVTILTIVTSFYNGFDIVRVLTKGGPLYKTSIYVYYIFEQGFDKLKIGYSSAISFIFFIIIAVFTIIQLQTQREE